MVCHLCKRQLIYMQAKVVYFTYIATGTEEGRNLTSILPLYYTAMIEPGTTITSVSIL